MLQEMFTLGFMPNFSMKELGSTGLGCNGQKMQYTSLLDSFSISTSLPPSPSSCQKEDREPAFLSITFTKRWVGPGGGSGGGGGGASTDAGLALAVARKAWCAAARAFERAFAAGPQ